MQTIKQNPIHRSMHFGCTMTSEMATPKHLDLAIGLQMSRDADIACMAEHE